MSIALAFAGGFLGCQKFHHKWWGIKPLPKISGEIFEHDNGGDDGLAFAYRGNNMEYKLFTTRFCHKCPSFKELMSGQDKIKGEFVDASSPEGLEIAKSFNVTGVPTVVFLENGEEVSRTQEKEEVEEVLGKF